MNKADYVVVGAGAGGSAVAARLAERFPDRTVAVLEAGPADAPLLSRIPLGLAALVGRHSRYNYAYETVRQPALGDRRGFQPRGRGVGGSTLINAMICIRGQPDDYDGWEAAGCTGWGWRDVLPVFRRLETNTRGAGAWHGASGPLAVSDLRDRNPATQAFLDAAREAGFDRNEDFNGARQEGVGRFQVFQRDGSRLDAGTAYLREGPTHPNLRIVAEAQVIRVLFDGTRAAAVEYRQGNATIRQEAGREIVLAGGAFGTPQLLMASGVGAAAHLQLHGIPIVADRPDVGRNLQDHLDYTINMHSTGAGLFGIDLRTALGMPAALRAWRKRGRGPLTSNIAEAGGFLRSAPDVDRPDVQLHFCIGKVDDHNRHPRFGSGYSLHVCVLRPHSHGEVTLKSADMRDPPLIDPRFLSDPRDLETLLAGTRLAERIIDAPSLRALGGRPAYGDRNADDDALRSLIRTRADTIYHPVGTCRMGSDAASVVAPDLRVRGVSGLRIADASIMPRLISGNTEAPTVMIGEKAADLIAADTGA